MKVNRSFSEFLELVKVLRGKDGCPWDREQTHQSIKTNLIEEAYETLEAIEEGDPLKLSEELGDLLLQVVFHSVIAEENRTFTMNEVIGAIHEKMVRRHPHVFGDSDAASSKEVLSQWERIKKKEKGKRDRRSLLDGVPNELPALLKAQRVQDKAARSGFDWENVDQVLEKVEEEMAEFREVFFKRDAAGMEEELGDLLFSLVNIARFIEISPEDALRKTINKFQARFRYMEDVAGRRKKVIADHSPEELDILWEGAKRNEKTGKKTGSGDI